MKRQNRRERRSVCLEDLKNDLPHIPRACGEAHTQAAVVCFKDRGHAPEVLLVVEGGSDSEEVCVRWKTRLTPQIVNYWKDMKKAAEEGAVGLAFLLARLLHGYTVVERAMTATGIDWWLGTEDNPLFQKKARLEVSGILNGTKTQVRQRTEQKKEQTKQSDQSKLPAYVVVVEFSTPRSVVVKR